MTIGKKIGGGFFVIILLTTVLGFMAIRTMNNGSQVSNTIAQDRLPRLLAWSKMQSDLLEGGYNLRLFYETSRPDNMNRFFVLVKGFRNEIDKLKKLNEKNFFEITSKGIAETEKLLNEFENIVSKNIGTFEKCEKVVKEMMGLVGETLKSHDAMNKVMFGVQRKYISEGKTELALQYISLIEDSTLVYGDAARLMQELLSAERNHDLSLFIKVQESLPLISKSARALAAKLHTEEGKKAFSVASSQYQRFGRLTHELVNVQREYVENSKLSFETFTKLYDATTKMVELVNTNTISVVDSAASEFAFLTREVSVILALVLALGIIVALIITRMIVKPLTTTQMFAQEVAAGHLDHELAVHTNDETGKLADALRSMVTALKRNISDAHQKSEQAEKASEEARKATANAEAAARKAEYAKKEGMLDAANQLETVVEIISAASGRLSGHIRQSDQSASESAMHLREAVMAMNEMNAAVQEVAQNADSASSASGETRGKAQAGEQVVKQVVHSIGKVQETSLQLKEDMAQLNERAQDISRIMGVISDIADQTNLLALNAAIEAARAGEAGRGFAVVADEVRKLAEKTMSSTLDVSNAIRAIQESTNKSMNAVDDAASLIGQATELANQSGTALHEIVTTVDATSDQVLAIAKASQGQSAANEEINNVITKVNDMSDQTARAMAEATEAVADLTNQTRQLTSLIKEMKNA